MEINLGTNNFIKIGSERDKVLLRIPVDDTYDAQFVLSVEQARSLAQSILDKCDEAQKAAVQ